MFGHDTEGPTQTQAQTDNGMMTHASEPTVVPATLMPPADDTTSTDAPVSPAATSSAPDLPGTLPTTQPASSPAQDEPVVDDLLDIKQEALQHLSPLVGHLDQTPEEKFRTTMMMIQAADDQSLIKTAYEAAKQITDEKTRAQALLDIINEINYFTQQHAN